MTWNVLRWKKKLKVGTWNVRTLLGDTQQELLCSSACRSKLGLIAVQECRWEEIEEGKERGGYLWFGGGAWKNSSRARTGGVLVGVHKSLEKAVMSKVHRKGRVQLVKLKGLMGRNLIFGSLYAPTESEEGDEAKRDDFWDGVHEAVNEIGCTERDIVLFGIDNNGETGECEVSDEEENEEEKEENEEEERIRSKVLGKWGFGKMNENGKRLIEECVANGLSI